MDDIKYSYDFQNAVDCDKMTRNSNKHEHIYYYGSGTAVDYTACTALQLQQHPPHGCCMHSPGGSIFLHEMTSWPPS